MSRYHGYVGYGLDKEVSPGIWKSEIIEHEYYGDLIRNKTNLQQNSTINAGITLNSDISIIADAFAYEHFYNMKYVTYLGKKWVISSIEVQRPRIILTLGGLYNENQIRSTQ